MTREEIEDAEAAAAFDGPSTPEERLKARLISTTYDLHQLAQYATTRPSELIMQARAVIDLSARLSRASFVLKN